ncbi:hypothetical protein RHGRI_026466 [Rhododendron griersonianum]|uniref:Uncharacterized protein n=1 Tax=Rhododendron griersonianum TaxID=479676 RepID=A0AAV6IV81_9ERIC|nr:hypothetical protein RHGRI_026466 [Rhododendron griersonianum]
MVAANSSTKGACNGDSSAGEETSSSSLRAPLSRPSVLRVGGGGSLKGCLRASSRFNPKVNPVRPNGGGLATGEVGDHGSGAVVCSGGSCLGCGVQGTPATAAEGQCTSCSLAFGGSLWFCPDWWLGMVVPGSRWSAGSNGGTIILSFRWGGLPLLEQLQRQMAPWTGMKLLISFSMAPLSRHYGQCLLLAHNTLLLLLPMLDLFFSRPGWDVLRTSLVHSYLSFLASALGVSTHIFCFTRFEWSWRCLSFIPLDVKEPFKTYAEGGAQITASSATAGATAVDAERILEQIL